MSVFADWGVPGPLYPIKGQTLGTDTPNVSDLSANYVDCDRMSRKLAEYAGKASHCIVIARKKTRDIHFVVLYTEGKHDPDQAYKEHHHKRTFKHFLTLRPLDHGHVTQCLLARRFLCWSKLQWCLQLRCQQSPHRRRG